jgi:hypothetical protein
MTDENGHVLVLWSPNGYSLREAGGSPPSVGDEIAHGELTVVVTKLGASPLPGDTRPCAYTVGK